MRRAGTTSCQAAATHRVAQVARPKVDFAFLRQQVSLEQVLGIWDSCQARQREHNAAVPPRHSHPGDRERPSVHRQAHVSMFSGGLWGSRNVLDLWAAIHRLPPYDAALHLAETFGVPRNREEEPVKGTR